MQRSKILAMLCRWATARPIQSTPGSLPDEVLEIIFVHLKHGYQTGDNVWVQRRNINECIATLLASALVCRAWYGPASQALYTNPRPARGSSCVALLRTLRRRIDLASKVQFVHLPVVLIEQRVPSWLAALRRLFMFSWHRQNAAGSAAAAQLASYLTCPNRKAMVVCMDLFHRPSRHALPWINTHVVPNLEYMQVESRQPLLIWRNAWWWAFWASLPESNQQIGSPHHIQLPQLVFNRLQTLHIKRVDLGDYDDDVVANNKVHLSSVFPSLRELILESMLLRTVVILAFLEATQKTMRSLTLFDVQTLWDGDPPYQESFSCLINTFL